MSDKLKNATLYLVIFFLSFLLLYKCDNKPSERGNQKEHYVDTVTFIKTHIDTILFDSIRVRTLTKYNHVNVYTQEDSSRVYRYVTDINDSLISGTIVTGLKLKDTSLTLLGQYIDYTPLFPKYIYRTDSVFTTIKDCTIVYNNKLNFMVGVNLNIDSNTSITPTIGLQLKNKTYIEVGYNPFSKSFLIGAKFKIYAR